MAIKFSEFSVETSLSNVSYLVGYNGGLNVQITPGALLAAHIPYTGAVGDLFLGTHSVWATGFKIPGGTLEQFLKADGSLDNNIYLTQNDLPTTLLLFATNVPSGIDGYFKLVNTIDDPNYNTIPVDIPTGNIIVETSEGQFIAGLITTPNQISGNPGIFNITTIGSIRKAEGSGSGQATFFYRIYKRNSLGIETLVCISDPTLPVNNGTYAEFQASGIFNDGVFGPTDTIVVKYYGKRIAGGSAPAYEFKFGGDTPVRTVFPIPTSAIPNIYLDDIANVYIDPLTLANKDLLQYNSTTTLWENESLSTAGIQKLITLTTTGTSGASTLINGTLNIPQYVNTGAQTFTGVKTFDNGLVVPVDMSATFGTSSYIIEDSVDGYFSIYTAASAGISIHTNESYLELNDSVGSALTVYQNLTIAADNGANGYGSINFYTNQQLRGIITNTGKFGINNSAFSMDGEQLQVTGNSLFTGNVKVTGDAKFAFGTKMMSTSLSLNERIIEVTFSSTITLPFASFSNVGKEYIIKNNILAGGTVTVSGSMQNIDGSPSYSLTARFKYVHVVSNGSYWLIIANN